MEWTKECFPFLSFISNQWLKKNLNRKIVFSSHFISSIFRSNILLFSSHFFLSCRCVLFVAVRLMINSISVRQPLRFIYHSRSMRVKHHLKPSLLNSFFYNFGHYASEKWNVLLVKWWRIHKVVLMLISYWSPFELTFNKTFCSLSSVKSLLILKNRIYISIFIFYVPKRVSIVQSVVFSRSSA